MIQIINNLNRLQNFEINFVNKNNRIIKTISDKQFPISGENKEIHINFNQDDLTVLKDCARLDLNLTYSKTKTRKIQSINFNPLSLDMVISIFDENTRPAISTEPRTKSSSSSNPTLDKNYVLIEGAVQAYMKENRINDAITAKENAESTAYDKKLVEGYRDEVQTLKDKVFSATPTGYEQMVEKVNSIHTEMAEEFNLSNTFNNGGFIRTIYGVSHQEGTPSTSDNGLAPITHSKVNLKSTGKNMLNFPIPNGYRKIHYESPQGLIYDCDKSGIYSICMKNGNSDPTQEESAVQLINIYSLNPQTYPYKLEEGCTYALGFEKIYWNNKTCLDLQGKSMIYIGLVLYDEATGAFDYGVNNCTCKDGYLTFTAEKGKTLYGVRLVVRKGIQLGSDNIRIRPIFQMGDESTVDHFSNDNVVYQENQITLDKELRSIEVTNSLNTESGYYNVELNGKKYITDTIEWREGKGYVFVQRIGKLKVDETIPITHAVTDGYHRFFLKFYNVPKARIRNICSDRFKYELQLYDSTFDKSVGYVSSNFDGIAIADIGDRFKTIEELREWFDSHPTEFYYVLQAPIETPLSTEQTQELLGIQTYDGNTLIKSLSNVKPIIKFEYSTDLLSAFALKAYKKESMNEIELKEMKMALIELNGGK